MAQSFDPHQTGIEQHSTRIGTANLYYEVAGAGKPLILIHGLSGSSRWWERNIAALAQYFRVYVVDLVGFGASRSDAPFALGEAEQVLYTWMERLDIRRASIVGHSMGGVIAAELAADYPALVERLILVDAAILSFTSTFPYHLVQLFREMAYVPPRLQYIIATDALRAGARTLWN